MDLRHFVSGVLCFGLLGAACDDQEGSRGVGPGERILGGDDVSRDHDPYQAVFSILRLKTDGKVGLCSATLIAPRLLLTAAHCVVTSHADGTYDVSDPSRLFVDNRFEVEALYDDLSVTDVVVHPDYDPTTHVRDLALLRLDQDATPWTEGRLIRPVRSVDEEYVGLPSGVELVGFGQNNGLYPEVGPAPFPETGARLRADVELAGLGCSVDAPLCDEGITLSYLNLQEGGNCSGDSGGALLAFRDAEGNPVPSAPAGQGTTVPEGGTVQLAGVIFGAFQFVEPEYDCEGIGLSTRVDTVRDFLDPYLADINGNGMVEQGDLNAVLTGWGKPGLSDVDGNGVTAQEELNLVLLYWGTQPFGP